MKSFSLDDFSLERALQDPTTSFAPTIYRRIDFVNVSKLARFLDLEKDIYPDEQKHYVKDSYFGLALTYPNFNTKEGLIWADLMRSPSFRRMYEMAKQGKVTHALLATELARIMARLVDSGYEPQGELGSGGEDNQDDGQGDGQDDQQDDQQGDQQDDQQGDQQDDQQGDGQDDQQGDQQDDQQGDGQDDQQGDGQDDQQGDGQQDDGQDDQQGDGQQDDGQGDGQDDQQGDSYDSFDDMLNDLSDKLGDLTTDNYLDKQIDDGADRAEKKEQVAKSISTAIDDNEIEMIDNHTYKYIQDHEYELDDLIRFLGWSEETFGEILRPGKSPTGEIDHIGNGKFDNRILATERYLLSRGDVGALIRNEQDALKKWILRNETNMGGGPVAFGGDESSSMYGEDFATLKKLELALATRFAEHGRDFIYYGWSNKVRINPQYVSGLQMYLNTFDYFERESDELFRHFEQIQGGGTLFAPALESILNQLYETFPDGMNYDVFMMTDGAIIDDRLGNSSGHYWSADKIERVCTQVLEKFRSLGGRLWVISTAVQTSQDSNETKLLRKIADGFLFVDQLQPGVDMADFFIEAISSRYYERNLV